MSSCYIINQFLVDSEIPLPCVPIPLPDAGTQGSVVSICRSEQPIREFPSLHWLGRRFGGQYLRAYDTGDGILVCAGESVRMHLDQTGTHIVIDCLEDQIPLAAALSMNLGLSLCTLLQGDLSLHCAAVELEGKLIALLAPSGTGKSTLLWSLLDQGARFVSDDVLPVRMSSEGVTAFPSVSLPAKLSRRAMEERGMDPALYPPAPPDEDDFWVRIAAEDRVLEPCPLAALFVLQPFRRPEAAGNVTVQRHVEGSALSLLMENTQGLWAAASLLDARRVFFQYLQMARRAPLYTLGYHRDRESLPGLVQAIRHLLANGGRS